MLARVEERQTTLFSRMDVYDETLRIVGQKMSEIENILAKRGVVFCILERGWWIFAGTGITLLLTNSGDILRYLTS